MKKAILLGILSISLNAFSARAQNSTGTEPQAVITAPNAVYLEILGSGLIYSINYDRMLTNNLAVRIGLGYFPTSSSSDNGDGTSSTINASITTIPVTLSWFPFSGRTSAPASKLEIGAGLLYADLQASTAGQSAQGSVIGEVAILGYRLEPSDGGFVFRAAFTPFLLGGKFQPFGGLSFGLSF